MEIVAQNLSKLWGEDTAEPTLAVDSATHHFGSQKFTCLLGPSGCGKSTLLQIIGGLTPAMGAVLRLNFNSAGGARECVLAHSLDELPRRIRKVHVYAQRRAATKNEKKQRKQDGATTTARTAGIAPTNATAAREKAEREAREGPDWVCVCGNINFGRRDSCNRCPVTRAEAAAAAPSGRVQSGTDTGSKKSSKKKKKKKKKRQKVHA